MRTVKMTILPNLTSSFSAIPDFFVEMGKLIIKHMWKRKGFGIAKTKNLEKRTMLQDLTLSNVKFYYNTTIIRLGVLILRSKHSLME